MGCGTAEWRQRAADGENGVGDEPWVAARAATGADQRNRRGESKKKGERVGESNPGQSVSCSVGSVRGR